MALMKEKYNNDSLKAVFIHTEEYTENHKEVNEPFLLRTFVTSVFA